MRMLVGLLVVGGIVVAGLPFEDRRLEQQRLQRHFATVLAELEARDVSSLPVAQRAARARHIARLRGYAARGEFPRNTEFAGAAVPFFVDSDGTRCAMAYLIEQAGQGEYVRSVAARMNNARIADIARNPELGGALAAWLDENGLSLAEAARIQPGYCWFYLRPPIQVGGVPQPRDPTYYERNCVMSDGAALVRFTTGTTALVLTALNAVALSEDKARPVTAVVGIGVGVLGLGILFSDFGDISHAQQTGVHTLSQIVAVMGGASILAGATVLLKPKLGNSGRVIAVPLVEPNGTGVAVQVRF